MENVIFSDMYAGLQGIEMGNYLIKKVVRELIAEFPRMQQFSSLSPIPGFKAWVLSELHKHQQARGQMLLQILLEQTLILIFI